MFWKLFSSERRVQEALEQSTGYDISPNNLNETPEAAPAATTASTLNLWKDYSYLMPANTQQEEKAEEEHHSWTDGLFTRRKA